jgi:hypothetical protein
MEIDSAIPPVATRLNLTIRQYAFRLAKLSPSHLVNLWARNKLSTLVTPTRLIQLDKINRSTLGLVDSTSLELIRHFKYAPWDKATPYIVNIAKLSKDDQAKSHTDAIKLLGQSSKSLVLYTDASSFKESLGIRVGLVSYELGLNLKPTILAEKLSNLGQE